MGPENPGGIQFRDLDIRNLESQENKEIIGTLDMKEMFQGTEEIT